MKSIFLSICAVMLTTLSFSQIKEGSVTYEMDMSSDDPEAQAQLAMFQGSKMSMVFNSDFSRLDLSFGMIMNMVTVINAKKQTGIMLMSGMLGKKAIIMTEKDLKDDEIEAKKPDMVITATDETKTILGYTCKKYIVTMEEGTEVAYWTTTEITAPKNKNKYMLTEVDGFPLEFETSTSGMKMTFSATDFKSSLKGMDTKKMFDTSVPEGYEEMTMDQLKGMGM